MLALLKACGISKAYHSGLIFKKHRVVLEEITLELMPGQTFGLMGESGSGKTTLGKILAGLERSSSGTVQYQDKSLMLMKRGEFKSFRKDVQMIFQDPEGSLNPKKSIEQSIHEVLSLQKVQKRYWRERTSEILGMVGLSDELLCRYPGQVSGGQNQRIALARVLLLRPKVIILDEPTASLDVSVSAQILKLLKELQKEMNLSYLLISHQPEIISFNLELNFLIR
jgi:peptide/nickel transport system ATP-binding protein